MLSSGKGSNRRPTDDKKYEEGYEKVFGKKPIREEPKK